MASDAPAAVGAARLGARALVRRGAARRGGRRHAGPRWRSVRRARADAHRAARPGAARPRQRAQPRVPARLRRHGRAAQQRARRFLELARPHVRRGAAHHARAAACRSPARCTASCCAAATRRCASSTTCTTRATARAYADPLAMSRALVLAAQDAGIGLTLLPVLYERAGFSAAGLRDDQRRFATTVDDVLALRDGVRALQAPQRERRRGDPFAARGARRRRSCSWPSASAPMPRRSTSTWPSRPPRSTTASPPAGCGRSNGWRKHVTLDARWQLVHATHTVPAEVDAVAASGAGVVLCPSTEANLGDGLPDLPRWLDGATPLSIGSDSHVTRDWREELRLLEYGQRLAAAAAQRGGRAAAWRAVDRSALVRARAGRRRARPPASELGPASRRARRPRGDRRRRPGARWARARAPARHAGVLEPDAAVCARDGRRTLGQLLSRYPVRKIQPTIASDTTRNTSVMPRLIHRPTSARP